MSVRQKCSLTLSIIPGPNGSSASVCLAFIFDNDKEYSNGVNLTEILNFVVPFELTGPPSLTFNPYTQTVLNLEVSSLSK